MRCIFEIGSGQQDGDLASRAYGERITLWKAASVDDAIARAETDAAAYAESIDAVVLGLTQAYQMDDELTDGAEVFSLVRTVDLEPSAYLDRFFDTGTERQRHWKPAQESI